MAEVIHFDPHLPRTTRRRNITSKTYIPRRTEGEPVFFDRRELNPILSLYGRMVAVNEWRDYAIDSDELAVEFQIYRNSWDFPAYRLIKRGAVVGRRRFALVRGGETLIEDDRLQTILSWLEKQPTERVLKFQSDQNQQRLSRPI